MEQSELINEILSLANYLDEIDSEADVLLNTLIAAIIVMCGSEIK